MRFRYSNLFPVDAVNGYAGCLRGAFTGAVVYAAVLVLDSVGPDADSVADGAFLALEHSVGEWSVAMVKMRSKEAK